MYRKLSANRFFSDATGAANELIACSRFKSARLPRTMDASALNKWAVLEIPMPLWIVAIESFQSFAHSLFGFGASWLVLMWRSLLCCLQLGSACARACAALMGMAAFDIEDSVAIRALQFCLSGKTFPGAETSFASGLINRKGFAASLASAFDLFDDALPPTFATAIFLLRLLGGDFKDFVAYGTFSCFHIYILT